MLLSVQLAILLAAAPSLVSAALFGKDSMVKVVDEKGFNLAMKKNETSLVAFVAPWCGHCQRMAPEYNKAALGLYPLIPAYAVNCNLDKNKPLCSREGVEGFPTVKLYPRGKQRGYTYTSHLYPQGTEMQPLVFQQDRTASGFWYFATRGLPNNNSKFSQVFELMPWVRKGKDQHRILLLGREKKVPLLWRVLANKYAGHDILFASIRDRKGRVSKEMNFEVGGDKESKVIVYPRGSEEPFRYEGLLKHESLSKFIDSVLDGTADIKKLNDEAKAEELNISEEELEIQRKQEAQRIALMHGGYTDIIDFEKAVKSGAGANFHDTHGYNGMMGDIPEHLKKAPSSSTESAGHAATPAPSAIADDEAPQVVLEASTDAPTEGSCSQPKEPSNKGGCPAGHTKDEL